MLGFTYHDKKTTGIFNGRFVFHAPNREDRSSFSPNLLKLIAEGDASALTSDALRHEYLHWLLFRHSKFGISTIGRRYRARSDFLQGNDNSVVSYYRQRTAYFVCSYNTHESIVERINEELDSGRIEISKVAIKPSDLQQLRDSDRVAMEATRVLGALPKMPIRIRDYLSGYRAALEYGLQCHVMDDQGQTQGREVALRSSTAGIFNSAFETEHGPQSTFIQWLKKLRRRFNRESRHGGLTTDMMGRWAYLKFSTEHASIENLRNSGYTIPGLFSYDNYAKSLAEFVFKHTLIDDRILESHLRQAIQACEHFDISDSERSELIEWFSSFYSRILYFFYVHGN